MKSYSIDLLVWTRCTEAVETELFVRVSLPAKGAHDFDAKRWDAIWDNAESVLLVLSIEYFEAGHGDNAGNDVVLLFEELGSIDTDTNFRSSTDDGDVSILGLNGNVTTLECLLDGRTLELWEVLAGKGKDGGCALSSKGGVVSSTGLVAISWTPHHQVGKGTEVSEGFDGLMCWAILSQSD